MAEPQSRTGVPPVLCWLDQPSNADQPGHTGPSPPERQSKSPSLEPRKLQLLSSALDVLNCAKMAHIRSRVRHGGGMEGERWGNGGPPLASRGASSVPFWHKTPSWLALSIINLYPNNHSPAGRSSAGDLTLLLVVAVGRFAAETVIRVQRSVAEEQRPKSLLWLVLPVWSVRLIEFEAR